MVYIYIKKNRLISKLLSSHVSKIHVALPYGIKNSRTSKLIRLLHATINIITKNIIII